ncbi:30S ribosomal protein S5 [Pasteuria penetrans]|uniref:30S ribosomal protein S5 n=1 Tax=Pasteuria penetrans TaxID=86005 RepID=UPI0011EE994A|nr:30S ribosomal protein S5 [Pasteuria penetrans]
MEKPRRRRESVSSEFEEKVVDIRRVAKVVKGGRRFGFSATVVIGDRKGRVGYGIGKALEVPEAIRKAIEAAKKNLITIPLRKGTVPHEVDGCFCAARVMIKPASPGTGLKAGGAVRHIMAVAGVTDVITKSYRSTNPINTVRATMEGLRSMKRPQDVARLRGKSLSDLIGPGASE